MVGFYGYFAICLGIVSASILSAVIFPVSYLLVRRKNKEAAIPVSLLITAPLTMVACCLISWILLNYVYSDYYPPSPRIKPDRQDIVGTWQLTEGSLRSIQEDGYITSVHTLDFGEDGTFVMTNMPDLVWNFGRPGGKYISGSGTWTIEQDVNGDWSIEAHFNNINGRKEELLTSFYLYGEGPPFRIYDWVGDPDGGRILTFER